MVGEPALIGGIRHLLAGPVQDAAALIVLGQRINVTRPQPE
jgi:hypothetical protein